MPEAEQKRLAKVPGYSIQFCPDCKWYDTLSEGRFGQKGVGGHRLELCQACHERINGFKKKCRVCGGYESHGGYEETSGGSWEPTGHCRHCKGSGDEP